MKDHFNWTCPYCGKPTTIIRDTNFSQDIHYYNSDSIDGKIALVSVYVVCPNEECKQYSVEAYLFKYESNEYDKERKLLTDNKLGYWRLKPDSVAIPQPEYIPEQIRKDYYEACKIKELSPKASATLSRRCLQGMIRDFWKISKSRLYDEISELPGKVDEVIWKAIDALRKIGNIGAHMEKDVNVIVDVDNNEAALLIELIEDLFRDWYISRHDREIRYTMIEEAANKK